MERNGVVVSLVAYNMSGCFMLLRNSVIDKIDLFDDNIFMYGEDTDLSRKLLIKIGL